MLFSLSTYGSTFTYIEDIRPVNGVEYILACLNIHSFKILHETYEKKACL